MSNKQRAKEAAREYWAEHGHTSVAVIIERTLDAKDAEHEAERDAAVAEAIERTANELAKEPYGYWWAEKVRALKPRSDKEGG